MSRAKQPTKETDRPLHHFLVITNAPLHWPPLAVIASLALLVLTAAVAWLGVAGPNTAIAAGAIMALAIALDAAVLALLPQLRISFGPIAPQLVTLTVARTGVALALALLALLWPDPRSLGLLLLAQGVGTLILAWGALWEARALQVTELEVEAPGRAGEQLRILHISDVHVERWGRREDRLAELARELAPDLILLTGDYTSLSFPDDEVTRRDARRFLEGLAAPVGIYAVLGSPDVDHNSDALFEGLPIRLLRDEAVALETPLSAAITLIGMECTDDRDDDAQRLIDLATSLAPADYRILIYHTPESALAAPKAGIDLYLCGHTHGGQIRLPLYGAVVTSSNLGKRFEMGRHEIDGTTLYVSRGVGLEGHGAPRVRLLCRPEITLVTLRGAPD